VSSREPLTDDPELAVRLARGEGYLAEPKHGWRESLTVDIATGKPDFHVIYPSNTRLPILMAAVTGVFFLSLLLKFYWTVPIAVIGVAALAWRWAWSLGRKEDLPPQSIGHDLELPNQTGVDRSPSWWGSVFLLTANATFFGSLLFGFAFLWTVAPGWPPPAWFAASPVELALGLAGAGLSVVGIRRALRANLGGGDVRTWLAATLAGVVAVGIAAGAIVLRAPAPDTHAYGATLLVLGGYALFHAALTALMVAFLSARVARGFTSPVRRAEFPVVNLWIDYLAVISALVLAMAHLPALLT
ncbi:MAG: cytochrome ubiquinol oxidase subunit I, partial [Brevundimonas sp.]|nr:cytochrome ubiquinol oxidase subunit I [Brevundimonas sp.]